MYLGLPGLGIGRTRQGGGGGAPPELTLAGTKLFLRADLGLDLTGGTWQDQSGEGNHVTKVSSPTLSAGAIGGQDAVNLAGGTFQNTTSNIIAGPGAGTGAPFSVLFVAANGNGQVFAIRRSAGYTGPQLYFLAGNYYFYSDGQTQNITSPIDLSQELADPFDAVFNFGGLAGNLAVTINGVARTVAGNPIGHIEDGSNGFFVGKNSNGQAYGGLLAEIRVLDHVATAPEIAAWRTYVLARYGNASKYAYYGRWAQRLTGATTINTGSHITARFSGTGLTANFNVANNSATKPTVSWQIDGGAWQNAAIGATLSLASGLSAGTHTVTMFVKGFLETENRWTPPIVSAVVFNGFTVTGGALLSPSRPTRNKIEFLGDSITEGVNVYTGGANEPENSDGRIAWPSQTAQALGAEWRQVGFGGQGVLAFGSGNVPKSQDSFPYIFAGMPRDSWVPDVVVINVGTNDTASLHTEYQAGLTSLLSVVRAAYPSALIAVMRPFGGNHEADIQTVLTAVADPNTVYVDTTGWLNLGTDTTDGTHPNEAGSGIAATELVAVLETLPPFA